MKKSTVRFAPVLLSSVAVIGCGGDPFAGPAPGPSPGEEGAYVFTVMCANCPGLTNVDIDRSILPHRGRLAVGRSTSIRAAAIDGCRYSQTTLDRSTGANRTVFNRLTSRRCGGRS